MTRRNALRVLGWNLAILTAGIVVVELIFGEWLREDPLATLRITRNGEWRYRVEYPGIAPDDREVVYRRDDYGLRGDYGSPEDIDLLTVGGSTTDQRFITEGRTWQDVLARRFHDAGRDIRIANAGQSGRTTFGHINDFVDWFPHIPGLRPAYVLFYVGINDMFFDFPNWRKDLVNRSRPSSMKELIKSNSAVYRVYRTGVGAYLARLHNLSNVVLDYASASWTDTPHRMDYAVLLADRVEGYRSRLLDLAGRVRAWAAVPIFVTQPRGDSRLINGKIMGLVTTRTYVGDVYMDNILGRLDVSTANGVDYYLMLSLFNEALLEVCQEVGGICIDLARELAFQTGDFYDHVHNTASGAARIGAYLFQQLKGKFIVGRER